jgi:hypothetical protein
MNYGDECTICGGDQAAGRLAKLLGHRPDIAWVKLARLESATKRLVKAATREWMEFEDGRTLTPVTEEFKAALREAQSLLQEELLSGWEELK